MTTPRMVTGDREALASFRTIGDQAFSRAAAASLMGGNSIPLLKDAGECRLDQSHHRELARDYELDAIHPPNTARSHAVRLRDRRRSSVCRQSDPYSYEAVGGGGNYFDMKRERLIGDGCLVSFADVDAVSVGAEAEPVRCLLVSGKSTREPIAWHGPIVMNTHDDLRIAFEELERNTFIKDRG